jgi:hypothetical protein
MMSKLTVQKILHGVVGKQVLYILFTLQWRLSCQLNRYLQNVAYKNQNIFVASPSLIADGGILDYDDDDDDG